MKLLTFAGVIGVGMVTLSYVAIPEFFATEYNSPIDEIKEIFQEEVTEPELVDTREEIKHVQLPEQVKTIYMTSCVAGTPSFRKQLVDLMNDTEINSVIIDVKDYSGTISFPPESESWKPAWQNARCGTSEMKQFIASLHEMGIFVIARITVFQDPFYTGIRPDLAVKKLDRETVWTDYKGLSFIDVVILPVTTRR